MDLSLIVGSCYQTGSPSQGPEDQDSGGDIPVFSAHQGEQLVCHIHISLKMGIVFFKCFGIKIF